MGSPKRKVHDVLIVGSGASGGWVAKEVAERGLSVLMLEAGPPRIPTRDFTEHVWPYQLKFRGFGDQKRLLETQPVQRLCYACDEYSHQFFVNDLEHPYTFPIDKPFMWIRGRQVGGKTFCWARESYRYSDNEFKAASRDSKFVRGYRFDGDGSQELYGHAFLMKEFGDAWRERVRKEIPYYFAIEAQGECLPRVDNYVTLDPEKKDAWGIPVLHVNASYGENDKAMAAAMTGDVSAILDEMKLSEVTPPKPELSIFGKNIHECGTARMGDKPEKSVVDRNCRVHDAKNLFVTDGSVFVTQGCYEPTLTIMAISARAGEHIAESLRRGEL